jgi:hypothetical protein
MSPREGAFRHPLEATRVFVRFVLGIVFAPAQYRGPPHPSSARTGSSKRSLSRLTTNDGAFKEPVGCNRWEPVADGSRARSAKQAKDILDEYSAEDFLARDRSSWTWSVSG